jgi:hypothetical protein
MMKAGAALTFSTRRRRAFGIFAAVTLAAATTPSAHASDIPLRHSRTGEVIPNAWFTSNQLPILDRAVPLLDADGDGFSNEEEWLFKTDPNDKDSHPAYEALLFLIEWRKISFRFKFQAYDGNGKTEMLTFQINPLDAGGRTKFVMIGDLIEGTPFKVIRFEFKQRFRLNANGLDDVSELTIENIQNGETAVLVVNTTTDVPTSFGIFTYYWGKKPNIAPEVFSVRKHAEFFLQPKTDKKDSYILLDVSAHGAKIQLPDGSSFDVPSIK